MDNSHHLLELIRDVPTRLIESVENMDEDFQASAGPRLLHEVFDYVKAGENNPLAGPGNMRKKPMFNRIVL